MKLKDRLKVERRLTRIEIMLIILVAKTGGELLPVVTAMLGNG